MPVALKLLEAERESAEFEVLRQGRRQPLMCTLNQFHQNWSAGSPGKQASERSGGSDCGEKMKGTLLGVPITGS